MAETTPLLRVHTLTGIEGSNPSSTAIQGRAPIGALFFAVSSRASGPQAQLSGVRQLAAVRLETLSHPPPPFKEGHLSVPFFLRCRREI